MNRTFDLLDEIRDAVEAQARPEAAKITGLHPEGPARRQSGGARQAAGPLVMDAALAAIAIEHGATLCTTDRDFARFPELHWTNPLISASD